MTVDYGKLNQLVAPIETACDRCDIFLEKINVNPSTIYVLF